MTTPDPGTYPDPSAPSLAKAAPSYGYDPLEEDLRKRALKRLEDKRALAAHVLAYVLVNGFLSVIWFLNGGDEFFWPIFPILGWGIGLAFNIWAVVSPEPTEGQIRAEMDRLRRH